MGLQKSFFNLIINKPVEVYVGLGSVLYLFRTYQTQTTFNYWFGKAEFDRRVKNGQL